MSAHIEDWAVPGLPRLRLADEPRPDDVVALARAVEQVLEVDPAQLAPEVARLRAEQVLVLQERLQVAVLTAVADVEERGLWAGAAAGSTRTWLRTLPCGDTGQLAAVRALAARPPLLEAVEQGRLGLRAALAAARALDRVPASVDDDQLEAVLVDGVGDLLSTWAGAACLEPSVEEEATFRARRDDVARAVALGLQDSWSTPAERLAPAFALVATVLTPSEVAAGLGLLVDALQPAPDLDAQADDQHRQRDLVLRKQRSGGWSLRAHLTDEVGQLLFDALRQRRPGGLGHQEPGDEPEPLDTAAAAEALFGVLARDDGPAGDQPPGADDGQRAGAGRGSGTHAPGAEVPCESEPSPLVRGPAGAALPPLTSTPAGAAAPPRGPAPAGAAPPALASAPAGAAPPPRASDPAEPAPPPRSCSPAQSAPSPVPSPALHGDAGSGLQPALLGRDVEGTPAATPAQRDHDAFARLLTAAAARPSAPLRALLTVTCRLDTLSAEPGARPAELHTGRGPVPLSPAALQRLACGSALAAVLTDAAGRPVAASGEHRDATARERRAMRAAWGSACAVNGCGHPGAVPHHVVPFSISRETRLADLAPLCEHHHHDVHEGAKTLRLRDGRRLDGQGWAA